MDKIEIAESIKRLKKDKDAYILAHNYVLPDIQDIADCVGDSLKLSQQAATIDNQTVILCGVYFMAETAKILTPKKKVLLPEKNAGCPMADMVTVDGLKELKQLHPNAAVVCYVNTSAAVKAESDICCTSSNALRVIRSITNKKIIFVPDKNLGAFVASHVPEKEIILWQGYCLTHHKVTVEEVERVKAVHPDAKVLVHPECRPEVAAIADFVGSTSQIIGYASKSEASKLIIGTEMGVLHTISKNHPDKEVYLLSPGLVCPNMKRTRLDSVLHSLENMTYEIQVDEIIATKARIALDRMLAID